jgi:hypothetical protein
MYVMNASLSIEMLAEKRNTELMSAKWENVNMTVSDQSNFGDIWRDGTRGSAEQASMKQI